MFGVRLWLSLTFNSYNTASDENTRDMAGAGSRIESPQSFDRSSRQLALCLDSARPVHGKFVTFGVTRGCIAVASPLSSITWLISP
jgi:hypothetical protein